MVNGTDSEHWWCSEKIPQHVMLLRYHCLDDPRYVVKNNFCQLLCFRRIFNLRHTCSQKARKTSKMWQSNSTYITHVKLTSLQMKILIGENSEAFWYHEFLLQLRAALFTTCTSQNTSFLSPQRKTRWLELMNYDIMMIMK